jgi:hypothetical protein
MQTKKKVERVLVVGPAGRLRMAQVISNCRRRERYFANPGRRTIRKLQILATPSGTELFVLATQSVPDFVNNAEVCARRSDPQRDRGIAFDKMRLDGLLKQVGCDPVSIRREAILFQFGRPNRREARATDCRVGANGCAQKLAHPTADEVTALGQGLAMACNKTRWREHVAIEKQQDVTLRRLRPIIAGRRPPHSTAANNPAPKRRSVNAKIWQSRRIWIVEHNNQLICSRPLRGDSRKATGKPGSAAPSYDHQT